MTTEFSITRRVEFSETDLAGIMHFTNFYRWMEICEHEFLRSLGLSVDMEDENSRFGWPRVKTSCRFKRPLRFEEEVEVKLIITEIRDRSVSYAFQFWKEENGERVKAAVGEVVAACVRFDPIKETMTPTWDDPPAALALAARADGRVLRGDERHVPQRRDHEHGGQRHLADDQEPWTVLSRLFVGRVLSRPDCALRLLPRRALVRQ